MTPVTPRTTARAAAILYAYRLCASFVVAFPASRAVSSFGAAAHPLGDRSLFLPGGARLLETLRLGGSTIAATIQGSAVVTLVLAVVGLGPLAAALTVVTDPGARSGAIGKRAVELFPIFFALASMTVLVQGAVSGAALFAADAASNLSTAFRDERIGDFLAAATLVPAALAVVGAGVLEDFARVAATLHGGRARGAIRRAFDAIARNPGGVTLSYVPILGGEIGVVAVAAKLAGTLDVGRPGAHRVLGVLVVHQAVLVALAWLRILWLRGVVLRLRGADPGGGGLAIDLDISTGGSVPAEIESHDAPA